ncbi:radical SAM/SPASM domain-containing protein [candidate division KSB1 bacterium]
MNFPDPAQLRSLTARRIWNLCKVAASYYTSRLTKRAWVSGYPVVLSIEPTSLCNLTCPQCPTGAGRLDRPQGYLSFDLYREMLDDIGPYLTHIQFFFQGEPFMHKQLPEMIRYAKDKNIYTITSTNGHFLTESTIRKILDAGLDVLIAGLDGVTPDVYLNYRKNGKFDKVVSGLQQLIKIRGQKKLNHPKVYLQFLVMKHNEDQIDAVRTFGRELNVDRVLIKTAQIYPDMEPSDFLPADKRYSRYDLKDGKLVMNVPLPDYCRRLWTNAVFTWDGKLASCCFDKNAEHNFGIWNGRPFGELWKSDESMKFRRQVLRDRKSIEICSNCTEGIKEFRK